ncbi:MAG: hypothetical protein MUE85_23700, partial [Microscillaceae bacterium]|nr:hypothetical protein [Microscillaceae bacterium]
LTNNYAVACASRRCLCPHKQLRRCLCLTPLLVSPQATYGTEILFQKTYKPLIVKVLDFL